MTTLVRAVAADVREHGYDEPLVRAVLRWFEAEDPHYFTFHVLPLNLRDEVPKGDAWSPLEWPNADKELKRTDRLYPNEGLRAASDPVAKQYRHDPTIDDVVGNWGDHLSASPAIIEVVRRLPDAFRAAGLSLTDDFAISATHFEAYGGLAVLKQVASPELMATLERRGELPLD